jgi:hypothetical protein
MSPQSAATKRSLIGFATKTPIVRNLPVCSLYLSQDLPPEAHDGIQQRANVRGSRAVIDKAAAKREPAAKNGAGRHGRA